MQYIVSTLLFLFVSGSMHDLHLSKSTVNYKTTDETLQITVNIFIDDLELALYEMGYDSLHLFTIDESEMADEYIADYINEYFTIEIDGYTVHPTWLGKEMSDDYQAAWCYLEVPELPSLKKMKVSNRILIDIYDDQRNIVQVEKNNRRIEDFLFSKNIKEMSAEF